MATLRDIETAIFELAPRELAMEWDNVGLLAGRPDREAVKILVALDVTEWVAEEAIEIGANLIVSHHPVMNCAWRPVQTVRDDDPQGRLLLRLIESGVGVVCMHTNLDWRRGWGCGAWRSWRAATASSGRGRWRNRPADRSPPL